VNYPAQYRQVPYSKIDFSDTSYQLLPFSQEQTNNELRISIQKFGILQPPLLLEQSSENFIILSGKQRLQLLVHTEETDVTALVLSTGYREQPEILFHLLLEHQLQGSPLSVIEQAVFFKKVQNSLSEEELLHFLPILGYKKKTHIPGELISLLQLDPIVQRQLHNGTLSLRSGKKLLGFNVYDQQALAKIIKKFKMGGSKQQKLIDLFFELSKRLKTSVDQLITSWQQAEKDKQGNGPQKTAALLNWLQQQCCPLSIAAEEDFQKFYRQLKLLPCTRLSHTPSFEDDQLDLLVKFSSKKELQKKWPQLKKILEQDS